MDILLVIALWLSTIADYNRVSLIGWWWEGWVRDAERAEGERWRAWGVSGEERGVGDVVSDYLRMSLVVW